MKKRRVTVEDVARAAGVSLMTVSRAMNNRQGISQDTRERILQLASQMNYYPSQIARSLATHQTTMLGLVVPDVSNPFFAHIARGAEDAAFENDYSVFLLNSDEKKTRELAALDSLLQKDVGGVILCSSRLPQEELQNYIERFPYMVLVNREMENLPSNIATVNVDDRSGAETAVRYFAANGRKKIALIAGPETSVSGQRRINGYKAGLSASSFPFDQNLVMYSLPTVQDGLDKALQLITNHPEIDSILAFNDLVAVGALQACVKCNKSVPTDIAIIGADDIPLASLVQPRLSTLCVNQYEIGRTAITLLIEMMENKKSFSRLQIIQPELVLRESG